MSAIRFHLSSHFVYGGGLGLANDLQNEHSIVGNFPDVLMIHHFGTEEQRQTLIPARLRGEFRTTFGLTEPDHGSDATFMSTVARRERDGYESRGRRSGRQALTIALTSLSLQEHPAIRGLLTESRLFLSPGILPVSGSPATSGHSICLLIMRQWSSIVFGCLN